MTQIISFEKLSIKNFVNKQLGVDQLEFEILLTVIRYVYAYMEVELDDPIEQIHPHAQLFDLFEGNRERFAHAFVELMKYWEIHDVEWDVIPINNEFETFRTIEDLCMFVEKKVLEK